MLARTDVNRDPVRAAATLVAAVAVLTMLTVFFFQYGLGYPPCPLCLDQRIAFYVTIPLAVVIAVAAARHAPRPVLLAGLAVIALAMLLNAALGVYHSGVEWKLWAGPQDCSGPMTSFGRASDLMKQLSSVHVVRCDDAPWRLFGLSLAGYDVLVSLGLAGVALWGVVAARRA